MSYTDFLAVYFFVYWYSQTSWPSGHILHQRSAVWNPSQLIHLKIYLLGKCDQIGQFLQVLCNKVSHKSNQNILVTFWAISNNVKSVWLLFGHFQGEIRQFFIPSSGHTAYQVSGTSQRPKQRMAQSLNTQSIYFCLSLQTHYFFPKIGSTNGSHCSRYLPDEDIWGSFYPLHLLQLL